MLWCHIYRYHIDTGFGTCSVLAAVLAAIMFCSTLAVALAVAGAVAVVKVPILSAAVSAIRMAGVGHIRLIVICALQERSTRLAMSRWG